MDTTSNAAPARPTFITVLCILTWVGCLIGLFGAIANIGIGSVASQIPANTVKMESSGNAAVDQSLEKVAAVAENAVKHAALIGWVSLFCLVLCALGAVWMWQLKKNGFYVYTLGELAPVIMSFILLGGMGGSGLMASLGILMAIIPIAFVIMYGLNLKHMK